MSSTWIDDREAEAVDLFGGDESAEDYFEDMNGDAEGFAEESNYDDAEAAPAAVRRRRARARARARRRAALARARRRRTAQGPPARPSTTKTAVRRTQAAVANLDLENKVQADAVASALAAQARRIRASETAVAASAVVNPLQSFLETFLGGGSAAGIVSSPLFKAGLPLAPLLVLRPSGRGLVGDPRAIAIAAVAGLAIADEIKTKRKASSQEVRDIKIIAAPELLAGSKPTFFADPLDSKGAIIAGKSVTWETSDKAVVEITDKSAGKANVKGSAGETARISAQVDDIVRQVMVTVK